MGDNISLSLVNYILGKKETSHFQDPLSKIICKNPNNFTDLHCKVFKHCFPCQFNEPVNEYAPVERSLRVPAHLRERAARRHEDCRCCQGNKFQCPYCETPKTALQDRYIRTSHLQDRYRMATTARVTPGTHNPSISAKTVRNRLKEAGPRACIPVVRQVLTRRRCCYGHKPSRWTSRDWQKSTLH